MFTKAKNIRFKNTNFTINTNSSSSPGQALNRLYDSTAQNAILNAGGRADEVRCHPGTREEVIGIIDTWRLDIENNVTANRIFWLSGPAGAGKTAIVQTIAESWKLHDIHTANFFFFRADPSRSHAKSFVSTLLCQIFDFFPDARNAVDKVLSLKPHILHAGVKEQVDELICNAFRTIDPPFPQHIVLLIDGLDECDSAAKTSQMQIIDILNGLVGQKDLPFLVLIASRAEPHILAAFKKLDSPAQSIFLDGQYSPEVDIRLFVTAEFEKIRTSHLHAALLPNNWPSVSDIDDIVQKSSGQFIYAATVMRFIAQPSAVPSLSLDMVQGIIPSAKNSPFVNLDAIYAYILHQADDDRAIHDILSSALLDQEETSYGETSSRADSSPSPSQVESHSFHHFLPPINEFLQSYDARYTESLFMSSISHIAAIVQFNHGRLRFYHASLSDFLVDQSRSGLFHVDVKEFASSVLPRVWNCIVPENPYRAAIPTLLGRKLLDLIQRATPEITDALLTEHPSDLDKVHEYFEDTQFLKNLSRLYYTQDIGSYKKILKRWITWAILACDSDHDLRHLDWYCERLRW